MEVITSVRRAGQSPGGNGDAGKLATAPNPTPFLAQERPPQAFRPLAAWGHFRKLVADKEDTAQVFYMGECLPSRRYRALAEAFCASAGGRARMEAEPYLPDLLD